MNSTKLKANQNNHDEDANEIVMFESLNYFAVILPRPV